MQIKRYRTKNIHEAVSRIKKDFGTDAVILSTKRLAVNDSGKNGHDLFEVTAGSSNSLSNSENNEIDCIINEALDDLDRSPGNFTGQDLHDHSSDKDNLLGLINSELTDIKEMLFLMSQSGGMPDFLHMNSAWLNLYTRLVKAGISSKQAQYFLKKGSALSSGPDAVQNDLTKEIIKEILASIEVSNPFEFKNGEKYFAAFIGPTGVGKTTTIAKLAAELSLKQKKNVGLISLDNYRIGAVEQLKTYAAIMGLPFIPAFTRQDLHIAVKKMQNKDVFLIDTAGHSHLDNERMKELGGILKEDLSIRCHLVLSVATSRSDMVEAADNFAVLNPETYVFTKLDETHRRGKIIDQIMELKMPISFLTNGQRVPEDIVPATKRGILRLIL